MEPEQEQEIEQEPEIEPEMELLETLKNSFCMIYSCNKITKTRIQISRQNRFGFFSNISNQMMI